MSAKTKILYIDDSELDRELVKDALEKEHGGFELTEAANKNEFEELLKTHDFDMVLSYFNIAGYQGLQVIKAVHAKNPRLPVVIVTGTGSEEIAVMAIKQGASDYVIKRPKHIQRLPETIFSVIEKAFLKNQRAQAESALIESEEKFRKFSENSLAGIYIIQNDILVYANPKFAEIFGYTMDECLNNRNCRQLAYPEDFNIAQEQVRKRASGEAQSVPYAIKSEKKDGTEIHIEIFGSSILLHGAPAITGVVLDITKRKQAEENLEWELRVNEALAALANVLIAPGQTIRDVASKVFVSARDLTESKHGFVSEIDRITHEAVAHTLTDMLGEECRLKGVNKRIAFPRSDNSKYGHLWGHALNTGVPFFTNSPQDHPKSSGLPEGHVPITRFLSTPVKYGGEVIGLIALANSSTDYTSHHLEAIQRIADLYAMAIHRNRNQEDGIRMKVQLQQAQKMESIGTLAGGIAHDFNNILSSIIGYTELAIDVAEKDTLIRGYLEEVYTAGNRAKDLVKQILAISRHDKHEIKPIQVAPLIKEVLKMLRSAIPTSIEIRENICNEQLIVQDDATQLHQVIVNLATNAKHAMAGEVGVLEVGVDTVSFTSDIKERYPEMQPGNYARITVSDTGSGIPAKNIDRIFAPYFTTKVKDEGTGLGLSVVHGIVKSHGGHITVYSETGKGTTFHVYLPLAKKAFAGMPDRTAEPLPKGTEHVLLIDDELPIVKMRKVSLERLGYTVTARTSSVEALEIFRASPEKYDIVITDMTMPNMTGKKLAQEVKTLRADVPVILCTGFSEMISGRGEDMDVEGFLLKPVDRAKMANTIRKILDNAKGYGPAQGSK